MSRYLDSLPWYKELGVKFGEFSTSSLASRHAVDKLGGEVVILAGPRALVPDGEEAVVYRAEEFAAIKRMSAETLREVHEVKRMFGGRLQEPEVDSPVEAKVEREVQGAGSAECHNTVPLIEEVFNAAKERGFPEIRVGHLILLSERGWTSFCTHPGTGPDLVKSALVLLRCHANGTLQQAYEFQSARMISDAKIAAGKDGFSEEEIREIAIKWKGEIPLELETG